MYLVAGRQHLHITVSNTVATMCSDNVRSTCTRESVPQRLAWDPTMRTAPTGRPRCQWWQRGSTQY
eukprot:m.251758 g.251758  ORF g.251758 m.251758 type:complete len:66 (-) comp26506_c3_seq30:3264-3461(-)